MNKIVIFGKHSEDWMEALGPDAEVWKLLECAKSLVQVDSIEGLSAIAPDSILIPLLENHIELVPKDFLALIPTPLALAVLRDKLEFAKYANQRKLDRYCPKIYSNLCHRNFPCVLKRTNLNAGFGLQIVYSDQELNLALEDEMFKNQSYLLQEFIPGNIEYVTHCVCKNGKILWDSTLQYQLADKSNIQTSKIHTKVATPREFLKVANKFLRPLSFSGPCNVDYKFNEQGEIIIFEINPRLGGSLMRPEFVDNLKEALEVILRLAISSKQGFWDNFKIKSVKSWPSIFAVN